MLGSEVHAAAHQWVLALWMLYLYLPCLFELLGGCLCSCLPVLSSICLLSYLRSPVWTLLLGVMGFCAILTFWCYPYPALLCLVLETTLFSSGNAALNLATSSAILSQLSHKHRDRGSYSPYGRPRKETKFPKSQIYHVFILIFFSFLWT